MLFLEPSHEIVQKGVRGCEVFAEQEKEITTRFAIEVAQRLQKQRHIGVFARDEQQQIVPLPQESLQGDTQLLEEFAHEWPESTPLLPARRSEGVAVAASAWTGTSS